VKKPAIITTPFPTLYEVADRLGVSRERADELREFAHSIMERERESRGKKGHKKAARKRATRKGSQR
jgi:hypothetical protein